MLHTLITLAAAETATQAGGSNPVQESANTFQVDTPFLVAQIVNFLLVAFLLWRFAFKPVLEKVDERQRKIADGLQYAEEMKHKLAETEKKYNEIVKQGNHEAQLAIEEAREHAKRLMEKQTQEAISRAEDLITNAKRAAAQEHEKMIANVRKELTELVVDTTTKVLRKELSEQDRKTYLAAATQELHDKN